MPSGSPVLVVGYDGSDIARHAVAHAVRAAQGGRVIVVHGRDAAPPQLSEKWRRMLDADHEEEGRKILDSIVLEGNDELDGATWETRLVSGSPAEAIVRVAAEEDADAIVVGSHGYGRLEALLGSVSHDVLRLADRPVTVVPARSAGVSPAASPTPRT